MSDHIYRTLRESQQLRDYSNYNLRFHRSLREAGWPTHSRRPTAAGWFWAVYVGILAVLVTAVLL